MTARFLSDADAVASICGRRYKHTFPQSNPHLMKAEIGRMLHVMFAGARQCSLYLLVELAGKQRWLAGRLIGRLALLAKLLMLSGRAGLASKQTSK